MYMCLKCKRRFEEIELEVWEEPRGECWGIPAYELVYRCPVCNGYIAMEGGEGIG